MATLPPLAQAIAERLRVIPGVLAVSLGGSHASGTAKPDSDIDLSLAYDASRPFDLADLNFLCRELDDAGTAQATPPSGWGPWVDGGAWLTVQGQRVDFIYREISRVAQSVQDALAGKVLLHAQPGHPHGIHAHHYAAELALSIILHDASGRLSALKERVREYPPALADALQRHYAWSPGFWLELAAKGVKRGDLHYAQGCAYQAVMAMVQDICARDRVWLLNEKGGVALAGRGASAPQGFEVRVNAALEPLDVPALRALSLEVGGLAQT